MNYRPITSNKNDLTSMIRREKLYSNIALVALSFCIIGLMFIFLGILYSYQIGVWITVPSFFTLIISLIISLSQKQRIKAISPNFVPTRNAANSIISIVCAIIPLLVLYYCLIVANGSKTENGSGAIGWIAVIYYWTAGVPLAIIWSVCGILGLKTKLSKLAIASLIIKPVGIVIFLILIFIQ